MQICMQITLAAHQRHVLIWPEAFECARRFEGVACNTDINECVRGTSNCAANSTCTNSRGAFDCACWAGYTGTALGQRCSLTLANLEAWSGTMSRAWLMRHAATPLYLGKYMVVCNGARWHAS